MRGLRLVSALLCLWAAFAVRPAAADEATDAFHTAVAGAYRHYREAIHYHETGNAELGDLALDQFLAEWKALDARYGDKPPPAYAKDAAFAETLTAIEGKAQSAVGSAPAEALLALQPIRADLAALRKRSGQTVFSDCIDAMNAAMDRLYVYFRQRTLLDFAKPRAVAEFRSAAAQAEASYRRCNDEAPTALRESAEFRRLMDGALASFPRLGQFLEARDEQQFYNTLGELRSFDKLIWLRFG
jgi:hypothetical protein